MDNLSLIGAALLEVSGTLQGNHPPDGLVNFINASSSSVSVSVDGIAVCSISPGSRCSTILSGGYTTEHGVSAESGGRSWSDRIKVSECHANWNGVKTYTFRDDSVPFTCAD